MIEMPLDVAKLVHKAILNVILQDGLPRDMVLLTEEDITKLKDVALDLRDSINICDMGKE
jgi:hypothetical protein